MTQQLVKRSAETALFDLNCADILGPSETIGAVTEIVGEGTGTALTFGLPRINTTVVEYDYTRQVPPGKVIQVLIGGGSVPSGSVQNTYIVRARFTTSNPGELREATARLLVIDSI